MEWVSADWGGWLLLFYLRKGVFFWREERKRVSVGVGKEGDECAGGFEIRDVRSWVSEDECCYLFGCEEIGRIG